LTDSFQFSTNGNYKLKITGSEPEKFLGETFIRNFLCVFASQAGENSFPLEKQRRKATQKSVSELVSI